MKSDARTTFYNNKHIYIFFSSFSGVFLHIFYKFYKKSSSFRNFSVYVFIPNYARNVKFLPRQVLILDESAIK